MGWSYNHSDTTKKHITDKLLNPASWAAGTELLAHCSVGSHFWQVIKPSDDAPVIVVTLIAYDRRDRCYGTKGLDESCGPSAADCPLTFLDMAPEANSYGWRDRVRAYHAARRVTAAKPAPVSGMVLRYDGTEYRLTSPAGPRKGWYAERVRDGMRFRLKAGQVTQAERA
jgi:hypothetical protein